jgi:hypothetical protein
MTKFQIKEKIRKHIESLNLKLRIGSPTFEANDSFSILARVPFRICDDNYDHQGEIVLSKRELQLILTPSEYEQFVQLIIDDIKS